MARAGDVIENPVTRQRIVFRKTAHETDGEVFEAEGIMQPGGFAGPDHLHPKQEERFEVLAGTAGFRIEGKERTAGPGEVLVLPPGTPHTFWNAGNDQLHVVFEFRPALESTDRFYETYFGLARDGKTNRKGMPNLLQVAVMAREYDDHARLPKPPAAVQKAVFVVLAAVGRLLGYRGSYPRYSGSA